MELFSILNNDNAVPNDNNLIEIQRIYHGFDSYCTDHNDFIEVWQEKYLLSFVECSFLYFSMSFFYLVIFALCIFII